MNYISIGSIIKEYRKRAGLTQVQLCEGLCEPPTMNKIENGKQNPNKKLLDAIVQRLQIPLLLNVPATDSEIARDEIEKEIDDSISKYRYDIENLLEKYRKISECMNKFEEQYYLLGHSIYLLHEKKDAEKSLLELDKAIRITFPDYVYGCNIQEHIFTSIEFAILNSISISYYHANKIDMAINLMQQLMICLENRKFTLDIFSAKYPLVAYNLSLWLGITKQYEKSLEISQRGIDFCLKHEQYKIASDLFYNQGFTLICMGKQAAGTDFIKKSLAFDSIMQRTSSFSASLNDLETSFGKSFLSNVSVYSIL